jgi:hypothetical protein
MKKLISLVLLLVLPLQAGKIIIGVPPAPDTSESPIEDDFTRANGDPGANWTEAAGVYEISSNVLVPQTDAFAKNVLIYSGEALTTENQAVKITVTSNSDYPGIVFRYTDAANAFYIIYFMDNENKVRWDRAASVADAEVNHTIRDEENLTVDSGDTFGVTMVGTGNSTVVRVWKNPTGGVNSITSSGTIWDGDATPDVTLTDDPASPVNSGVYVGLTDLFGGTAPQITYDNFHAGDIP